MDTDSTLSFGSYPQDKVKDRSLINALNGNYGGELNAIHDSEEIRAIISEYHMPMFNRWHDYRYHGEMFRKVPTKNGIEWYCFQPIKWQVLKEQDGVRCLLADTILDAQMFNVFLHKTYEIDDGYYYYVLGTRRPGNEFEASFIKLWLNGVFFSTAFSEDEKKHIINFTDLDLRRWDEKYESIGTNKSDEGDYSVMFRSPQEYPQEDIHCNRITLLSRHKATALNIDLSKMKPSAYALSQGFSDSTWLIDKYDYYQSTPCRAGIEVECFDKRGHVTMENADTVFGVLPMIYISD